MESLTERPKCSLRSDVLALKTATFTAFSFHINTDLHITFRTITDYHSLHFLESVICFLALHRYKQRLFFQEKRLFLNSSTYRSEPSVRSQAVLTALAIKQYFWKDSLWQWKGVREVEQGWLLLIWMAWKLQASSNALGVRNSDHAGWRCIDCVHRPRGKCWQSLYSVRTQDKCSEN